MSTEDHINDLVRRMILEFAPIRADRISGTTQLVVDLGYDSLRLVELTVALEDRFQFAPDDEDDAMNIETVADVEERVYAMMEATNRGGKASR